MDVEFDSATGQANIAKHGVSLVLGAVVIEEALAVVQDARRAYGEDRFNAFGLVEGRLFVCTYTLRDATHRIISVRKAHMKEQARFGPSSGGSQRRHALPPTPRKSVHCVPRNRSLNTASVIQRAQARWLSCTALARSGSRLGSRPRTMRATSLQSAPSAAASSKRK
jgi:uncharacterized DUF497 family protein